MSIGGNIYALLQVKDKGAKNSIGAYEIEWVDCTSLKGWLDLSTGDSKHNVFNAKIQESTHIFGYGLSCYPTWFLKALYKG